MPGKSDCIFCRIAKKEIPAPIEYEDESVIAFNDKNPQAPIHILIIPKKHISKVSDVTMDTINLLGRAILAANEIAKKNSIVNNGYRLVINCGKDAGQIVEHLHIHLLGGRKLNWPPG